MEKNDLIQLEEIIKNTYSIFNIYKSLIILDINDKKNSDVYQRFVNLLLLCVDKEESLFEYFANDFNKTLNVSNYLAKLAEDNDEPIFEIIYQDENAMLQTRILLKFKEMVLADTDYFAGSLDDYQLDMADEDPNIINYLYEIIPIEKSLTNMTFSDFTDNSIKLLPEENIDEKDDLTSIKYFLSFLDPELEKHNLRTSFGPISHNFDQKINIEFPDLYEEIKAEINSNYGYNLVMDAFDEMIEMERKDITSSDSYYALASYINIINTGLLFMDKEDIEDLQIEMEKILNDKNYIATHPSYEAMKQIVSNIFKNLNKNILYANSDIYGKGLDK